MAYSVKQFPFFRLSDLVSKSRDENEVLSKVLESVTKECETLRASRAGNGINVTLRDFEDKVKALRNTCRALENENELLIGE